MWGVERDNGGVIMDPHKIEPIGDSKDAHYIEGVKGLANGQG